MEKTATHSLRGALRVMLYCYDLVLSPESEIEVVECFKICKAAMKRRGLKVNNRKIKILVSGKECYSLVTGNTIVKSVVVGFVVNSVRCIEYTKWIHKLSDRMLHMPSILYVGHIYIYIYIYIYKQGMSKSCRRSILCRAWRGRGMRGVSTNPGDSLRILSSISPPGRPSTKPTGAALSNSPRNRICTPQTPVFRQARAICQGLCDGPTWKGRDLHTSLATAHSVLIQNPKWAFTPEREWPSLYCRPPQVRWCLVMLVFAKILPQLEHSPLSALYTLGARGLAPCSASCPPLASLTFSLLPAMPAWASHVLLCLAILFLETSLPHVPHLALLVSFILSPIHLFPWFFQLFSVAKVALHLLHVNVFRCFSCSLTWWILSAFWLAHFSTVGISAYEVLHLLSSCFLSVSSCFLTPLYSHLVGSPGAMVSLLFFVHFHVCHSFQHCFLPCNPVFGHSTSFCSIDVRLPENFLPIYYCFPFLVWCILPSV